MAQILTVRVDTRQVERAFRELGRDAPKAIARALNRTMGTTKTHAVRAAAADLALTQKAIRDSVRVITAAPNRPETQLLATDRRIPLIHFGARGPEPSRGRGVLTYRLPGGRGRIEGAFIATMKSGHRGVYRRVSNVYPPPRRGPKPMRAWLPITELHGPSVSRALLDARINDALRAVAQAALAKNVTHEIDFLISKRAPQ